MINHDKLISYREKSLFFTKLYIKLLINIALNFIKVIY